MMGFGYLGSSSSSASGSSNLSPLAPPFTVYRSNHSKPMLNSNPISHFNDPSVPFNSSWSYSHPSTSTHDFSADSIRTATVASANGYGYISPQSTNPPPNHSWSAVNPSTNSLTDSVSYNLCEAKPFYPPYVSSVKNDDTPLVTLNEPSYDLFSASGLVRGNESFKVDYTQSLSGLEYNHPQREGLWSGPPCESEGKQRKRMESDDSFFVGKANVGASLAYSSYMNQGAIGVETLSKAKDDPTMFYYADAIRRENNVGTSSFSSQGFSKGSPYRAFPLFPDSHPLVSPSEPPNQPWNAQNSCAPYEKKSHMFDCSGDRILPSLTKSSPSVVIKPPSVVSSFSTQPANITTYDRFNFEFKARPIFQVPDINIPNVDNTESVKSAANSFEHLDRHNPAEDSPCWKGATTSYFSPFGSPEAESPQHPTKKLQMSNVVNSQGSHTPHSLNQSSKISSSELLEITESNERTSTPYEKEHKSSDTVHEGFDSAKSSSRGAQTSQLKLPNLKEGDSSRTKTHIVYGDMEHSVDVEKVSVFSVKDAANLAADKKVNTNVLVKALNDLSDTLLRHCLNDGCALTEQDHKTLDRVIGNLDACVSRKNPQVTPSQKSMFQEVTNETTDTYHGHHRRNGDIFGENVVKLSRDEAELRKDHNMVQAIKKILDENLECKEESASQILLFKNLWLEAEAALCAFNYRARFDRVKGDMEKSKLHNTTVTTANGSADLKTPLQPILEADDSEVSNSKAQNQCFSGVDSDVEASVMARFMILKRRGDPNPVDVEEQELAAADDESRGYAASVQSHSQHQLRKDDAVVNASGSDDVEPSVMARLNILKRRCESNPVEVGEQKVADAEVPTHFLNESNEDKKYAAAHGTGTGLMQNQLKPGWYNTSYMSSDWENIVKDEYSWQNGRLD